MNGSEIEARNKPETTTFTYLNAGVNGIKMSLNKIQLFCLNAKCTVFHADGTMVHSQLKI